MLKDLFYRVQQKLEGSNPDVEFYPVGFISKGIRQKNDKLMFRTDEGEESNPDRVGRFITIDLDEEV